VGVVYKQSSKSFLITIAGFIIGAVNLLVVFPVVLSLELIGLTKVLVSCALLFGSFAQLGFQNTAIKFFPHFKGSRERESGFHFVVLSALLFGGIAVTVSLLFFKDFFASKFAENSPEFIAYFYHTIPLFLGVIFYNAFESFSFNYLNSVLPSVCREVILRVYVLLFSLIYYFGFIDTYTFVTLFCYQYVFILLIIVAFLVLKYDFRISFNIPKLFFRLKKPILIYSSFILGRNVVDILGTQVDAILLAGISGLEFTAIYMIAEYIATLIYLPNRILANIVSPIMANAWKERDMGTIKSMYQKSSINQFVMGIIIFSVILINLPFLYTLLGHDFSQGYAVFLILGSARIMDMAFGLNNELLTTSKKWGFNFLSNISFIVLILPLNIFFITKYGIVGPALANIIGYGFVNLLRFYYIRTVFGISPFVPGHFKLLFIGAPVILFSYFFAFDNLSGNIILTIGSLTYYALMLLKFDISPDIRNYIYALSEKIKTRFS
jgi:O-antigen/teichoic acid export membrane protein